MIWVLKNTTTSDELSVPITRIFILSIFIVTNSGQQLELSIKARVRNIGWSINYFLVSNFLIDKIKMVTILLE